MKPLRVALVALFAELDRWLGAHPNHPARAEIATWIDKHRTSPIRP